MQWLALPLPLLIIVQVHNKHQSMAQASNFVATSLSFFCYVTKQSQSYAFLGLSNVRSVEVTQLVHNPAVITPLCVEKTRRNCAVDHFAQSKCRFDPRYPGQACNLLAVNDFIIFDRCGAHHQQIVIPPAHQVTPDR